MKAKELIEGLKSGTLSPEEAVEKAQFSAKHVSGVSVENLKIDIMDCGFPSLNEYMVFKENRPELVVFGARPSMGKSAFIFQVAAQIATHSNVLVYSLEMDDESIVARMVAGISGRGLSKIQKGEVEQKYIREAKQQVDKLHLHIDDRSGLDVATIRSSANAFHKKHPLSLVVVDYLQLVKSRDRQTRNEEVGDVSAELKNLAKDLNCPVLVAAQLNRECERRGKLTGNYIPIMADLRDSGNIEQDADIIMFLSRQQVYDGTRPGEADISIAKARNGGTGNIIFDFLGVSTRFKDRLDVSI